MDNIPVEILACVVYLNPNGCVRASSKMAEILPTMWEKIYTLRRIYHLWHKSIYSFISNNGCLSDTFMASDQKNAPEVVKLCGYELISSGGSFPLVHVCTSTKMYKYEPMLQIAYEYVKDDLFMIKCDGVSGDGVSGDGVSGDGVSGDGVSGDGGALKKSPVTDENTYINAMAWLLSDRVFI